MYFINYLDYVKNIIIIVKYKTKYFERLVVKQINII